MSGSDLYDYVRISNDCKEHVCIELRWKKRGKYQTDTTGKYSFSLYPKEVKTMKIERHLLEKENWNIYHTIILLAKESSMSNYLKLSKPHDDFRKIGSSCFHVSVVSDGMWMPGENAEMYVDPYPVYKLKYYYASIVRPSREAKFCQKHFYLPFTGLPQIK